MNTMNNLKEVRRQNLDLVLASLGGHGAQKKLSEKSGIYHSHISNLHLGYKEMGEEIARKIEAAMCLSSGWLDQPHSGIQDELCTYAKTATLEEFAMEQRLLALWAQLSCERQQIALEVLADMALAEHYRPQTQTQTQTQNQTQTKNQNQTKNQTQSQSQSQNRIQTQTQTQM